MTEQWNAIFSLTVKADVVKSVRVKGTTVCADREHQEKYFNVPQIIIYNGKVLDKEITVRAKCITFLNKTGTFSVQVKGESYGMEGMFTTEHPSCSSITKHIWQHMNRLWRVGNLTEHPNQVSSNLFIYEFMSGTFITKPPPPLQNAIQREYCKY